jgi:hypothetical protein
MVITFSDKGDFSKTFNFLNSSKNINSRINNILNQYGSKGVELLSRNTPVDTGKTANSWSYRIEINKGKISLNWYNSNVINGVNIAVILQYGHGTQNGGYISGKDYINPVLRPLFNEITNELWREVTRL